MSQFEIKPIEPSSGNVRDVLGLVAHDLRIMGASRDVITRYTDTNNRKVTNNLTDNLEAALNPDAELSYLGISLDSEIVAYMKTNEWTAGDQLDFTSSYLGKVVVKSLIHLGNHVPGRPMGIHGLVVHPDLATIHKEGMVDALLDAAVEGAGTREIRIAQYQSDTIRTPLLEHGFTARQKFGRPIGNISQQLYIRPEDPILAQASLESAQRAGLI
jgi:hypothetical protein